MSDSPPPPDSPDEGPTLGLDEPPQPAATTTPYRVLARKYRPQKFSELIGQEDMVQTLANAIRRQRIAHAFLLTGVRGVGKTSTARLLAKALNCIGPDGTGGPTIDPCNACEPCRAITEGRHIDVVEMDAASHTSVANVREIIEAVRYAAVSARYKIYIIDEVHMLSTQAFNALLKTLEEPPGHVKFLFATTEVNRVPVTILSRCQRFDLRRVPAERLAAHFQQVAQAEGVTIEADAIGLIARAAEGSVRDGLSMLDQAISHGSIEGEGGTVDADRVRVMLGLADRSAVRRLLGLLLGGDPAPALALMREQYDLGVEPVALMRGLMEQVHAITRLKAGGAADSGLAADDRLAIEDQARALSHNALHRLWQLLLKGLADIESAPLPYEAAEMALLRILYAAGLPDPGLPAGPAPGGERAPAFPEAPQPQASPETPAASAPPDFRGLVARLADAGKARLAIELTDDVGLVSYAPGELVLKPLKPLDPAFAKDLSEALFELDGVRWRIRLAGEEAEASLFEQEKAADAAQRERVLSEPLVAAAIAAFPEAELRAYRIDERNNI